MSKVIRDCIGFALLRFGIGLEHSRHPLNQSGVKLKPIATCLLAFSRALGRLHVFISSSHWLLVIFSFVLIDRCDYFGNLKGALSQPDKNIKKINLNHA